jgi:hypothetical protein
MQSLGASANISAGMQTNTLLGGVTRNVTGGVTEVISAAWQVTASTIKFLSNTIQMGLGPYKALLNVGYHTNTVLPHVHLCASPGSNSGTPLVPDGMGFIPMPATPGAADKTTHLTAS